MATKKDTVFHQRYECEEDGHSKFWEISEIGPDRVEAGWGKIGKAPQGTKVYTMTEALSLIPSKEKKGYRRVS